MSVCVAWAQSVCVWPTIRVAFSILINTIIVRLLYKKREMKSCCCLEGRGGRKLSAAIGLDGLYIFWGGLFYKDGRQKREMERNGRRLRKNQTILYMFLKLFIFTKPQKETQTPFRDRRQC